MMRTATARFISSLSSATSSTALAKRTACRDSRRTPHLLFRLNTPALSIVVATIVLGTTLVGVGVGRYLRERSEGFREPFGVVQAALVGFVALILAFGLTMAVGRYEARRAAVVDEANTIGT